MLNRSCFRNGGSYFSGKQDGCNFKGAEDHVRQVNPVAEAEKPRGSQQDNTGNHIDGQMHPVRDHPGQGIFVIGEQAVDQGRGTQDYGHQCCGAIVGKSQQPGSRDEQEAYQVIQNGVCF